MPSRPRQMGHDRCARTHGVLRDRGRVIGFGAAAGAVAAFGMTSLTAAPRAHADIEDLIIQPIVDALTQAASALDPSAFDTALDAGSLMEPAAATALTGAGDTVPLTIFGGTEPLVDLSVNGGPQVEALVDTGSNGLVIPWYDLGLETLNFFPVGEGIGAYTGGLDYFYLTYDMPVDFGNVVSTAATPVDVELFSFPTSFESYFSGDGAQAILGIGPNAVGPGSGVVTTALPAGENQGILINESIPGHPVLEFGPNPDVSPGPTVGGAPDANLDVSVTLPGGQPITEDVPSLIDSGGVYGTIPSSLVGGDTSVPDGTLITVSTTQGQELYSYVVNGNAPTVTTGDTFNTGSEPFLQGPIYIGTAGSGSTVFDY